LPDLAREIQRAPKYQAMGIPDETVLDLLTQEAVRYPERRDLLKVVRRKLHNIMAPYLEDLSYPQAEAWIAALDPADGAAVKAVCGRILASHASSRERMPFLAEFYQRIFAVTGAPASVLDLACGLHPFSYPWMGLDGVQFHACDIHQPRVRLINRFFERLGLQPLAEVRDVLVDPPAQTADMALIFKEAHRMEKRKPGCSRPLWQALRVRWLLVSLPAVDLSGSHDLTEKHRALVADIVNGLPWTVREIAFSNEIVFMIDKGGLV
jgi:16S rRNA (guanine(1405)-N(7))-methyltransferase